MAPGFPNLLKYMNLQFPEAQRTPNIINSKRTMHIFAKLLKMTKKHHQKKTSWTQTTLWRLPEQKRVEGGRRRSKRSNIWWQTETWLPLWVCYFLGVELIGPCSDVIWRPLLGVGSGTSWGGALVQADVRHCLLLSLGYLFGSIKWSRFFSFLCREWVLWGGPTVSQGQLPPVWSPGQLSKCPKASWDLPLPLLPSELSLWRSLWRKVSYVR